jgi:hypothetical protein
MKSVTTAFLLFFSLFIISCKKEANPIPTTVDESQPVFHLENQEGSYFVYLVYEVDSLDNETQITSFRDSVYIVNSDSVINGNAYVHYEGTWFGIHKNVFIRDSSGFMVNQYGSILFNYINYTDTTSSYSNATQFIFSLTASGTSTLNTAAGTFPVIDHQLHYYNSDGTPFTVCDSFWVQHTYYSVNGGEEIITQTAFISPLQNQCKYLERRLEFLHLE